MLVKPLGLVMIVLGVSAFGEGQTFSVPNRPPIIKIKGEVLAYDTYSPRIYLSSHPPQRTYLVRVSKLYRGTEPSNILLVKNEPSSSRASFVKYISEGKYDFRMTLRRSRACDSSIKELSKNLITDAASSDPPPFTWVNNGASISRDSILPCYILRDGDFDNEL